MGHEIFIYEENSEDFKIKFLEENVDFLEEEKNSSPIL